MQVPTNKKSSSLSSPTGGQGAAIILAGGLGTRLKETVPALPKCLAPVAGRPFLSFVIDALRAQGIEQIIFSLGYKADIIKNYLASEYPFLDHIIVEEDEPLGTGGAIKLACSKTTNENVLIVNGDTLFKINVTQLEAFHHQHKAVCSLALKPMKNFDRYGVVELDKNNSIISFKEKKNYAQGLINGGVYLLNVPQFLQHSFPKIFSFEKDYLEQNAGKGKLFGCVQDNYFIDIGVPEDYEKAQSELIPSVPDLKTIDKSWTLLLDRDGVINEERLGKYVLNRNEFVFTNGTLDALKDLSALFGKILLITNQRGIGKKLMTEEDLEDIHKEMLIAINNSGGRIDKIYYCTEVEATCFNRKPNPGMGLQALKDFNEIDFSRTIMVGNKPSDMRFGRSLGMITVFITTTNPDQPYPHPDIDFIFSSLYAFSMALQS